MKVERVALETIAAEPKAKSLASFYGHCIGPGTVPIGCDGDARGFGRSQKCLDFIRRNKRQVRMDDQNIIIAPSQPRLCQLGIQTRSVVSQP